MSEVMGFKSFEDFLLSCKRFGIFSNTKHLNELGSGVVLYFDFLKYCAVLVVIYFVFVALPIMVLVTHPGDDVTSDRYTRIELNLRSWQDLPIATSTWLGQGVEKQSDEQ